jgi:hypothetical protein
MGFWIVVTAAISTFIVLGVLKILIPQTASAECYRRVSRVSLAIAVTAAVIAFVL